MFKQSEIGKPCDCGVSETVAKEIAWKRYKLPEGHFKDGYNFRGGFYSAEWLSRHCEKCGNKREDFMVWKWHGDGDLTPIDGVFIDDKRPRRYPEIYQLVRDLMPE